MTNAEYMGYELAKLGDVSEEWSYVKFRSDNGETRWMTLTPEILSEVSAVLTKERKR